MSLRVVGESESAHSKSDVYWDNSENRAVTDKEIEEAEDKLREEAKSIVKDIDNKYWDLGRCLYDVYDGVPGGYRSLMQGSGSRKVRQALFEKWGYRNFGDYCEREVGIRKRTGENLRYAYFWFAIRLDLPEKIIDEVKSLGRSKIYQLSGFVNQDNITLWIEKARDLTFEELKKSIKQAKAVQAGMDPDGDERDPVIREPQSEGKSSSGGSNGSGSGGGSSSGSGVGSATSNGAKDLPQPEKMHTVTTSLYQGQFDTWQSAIERAKSLSGSEKIGHNLELICQDFLANNDFYGDSSDDKKAYLNRIERKLGVLLVAIDPDTGSPIHGTDLLWKLVEEKSSSEE